MQSAHMTIAVYEQNPDGFLWIWVLQKTILCWEKVISFGPSTVLSLLFIWITFYWGFKNTTHQQNQNAK